MTTCSDCKRKFPNRMVQEMAICVDGKLRYRSVCPPCALEIGNRIEGVRRTRFDGPQAQRLLEEAQQFLARATS